MKMRRDVVTMSFRRCPKDIDRNGYDGIGKPEALKHQYQGYWSRRIDSEHRLVYRIEDSTIHIIACRFHYGE